MGWVGGAWIESTGARQRIARTKVDNNNRVVFASGGHVSACVSVRASARARAIRVFFSIRCSWNGLDGLVSNCLTSGLAGEGGLVRRPIIKIALDTNLQVCAHQRCWHGELVPRLLGLKAAALAKVALGQTHQAVQAGRSAWPRPQA